MMASLFSNSGDAEFAAVLGKLAYCNPFLSQRIELEKSALGDAYIPLPDWNLDPRAMAENANLRAIRERCERLAQESRLVYLKNKGSKAERRLYRDLIFFLLFHQNAEALDRIISLGNQHPGQRARVPFLRDFEASVMHFLGTPPDFGASGEAALGVDAEAMEPADQCAHLLALFFQIRRAFHNIFRFIIGRSDAATRLRARVWQSIFTHDITRYERVLHGRMREVSTLVTGPSGSGKEVVARAIVLSQYIPLDRRSASFTTPFEQLLFPVNLAALSQTLIESEIFGHRKGAFTGALTDRVGYFEACGPHGSVFLDEIGEANPAIQVKLLRVLQERRFQPVGATEERIFAGKIIAATNRDLEREIDAGRFREDLYYRLCADIIRTPSLAELAAGGSGEMEVLVEHISRRLVGDVEAPRLTGEVMAWVSAHRNYGWPGNFRELEQAVRNILVHGTYERRESARDVSSPFVTLCENGILPAEEVLRRYTLHVHKGTDNYSETARLIGLDRRTVRKYCGEASAG